jgi:pimeloyl-ACP methyl ester carboxylesterase
VLFLHGVAGAAATYRWLSLEGRTSVRLDFRGHGASDRAPGSYRLADYVADALSVLDEPAFVVGHSLGGVVAWTIAQQRPDLVTGLFLEDPPLFMGEPAEHALNPGIPHFRALRLSVPAWQADGISEAEAVARLSAQPFAPDPSLRVGDVVTEEALAARAYALLHLDPAVLDTVINGSLLAATDTVSPVTVPVRLLAADDALGAAFPTRHEERLAASHPDVAVERLAGAGHSIHDERAQRDAYLDRVSAFIAEVGRDG